MTIYRRIRRFITSTGLMLAMFSTAHGQIATDGTVGSAQSLTGPNYAINAGLGTQRGANLFHSFSTFNIHTGESATFTGPNGLQNVISRVTGGGLSNIDGTLRSEINGANVWFINPAGVVFGANAKLDVPAAFNVSTADELRFADGAVFSAANPAMSTLSAEPIAAFGFVNAAPKRIEVNGGYLNVREGQTLSLVGGDINLSNATIYAPAGRLNVASVGSAGEVVLTNTDVELRGFGALGTITMVRDPEVKRINELADLDTSGVGGGAILIRGGNWFNEGAWVYANTHDVQPSQGINISIADNILAQNGGQISASTLGFGDAGDIFISAGNLRIDGQGIPIYTAIASSVQPNATGVGGNVNITVSDMLTVQNGGVITAGTFGSGDAGNITISARNLLINRQGALTYTGIASGAEKGSIGAGGQVDISVVDTLTVQNGSTIFAGTLGTGDAGDITISTRNLFIDRQGAPTNTGINSDAEPGSTGAGGRVGITATDTLTVQNGSTIFAGTFGAGDAGDVVVDAKNLLIDGQSAPTYTAIASSVQPGSTGTGGQVNITISDMLTVQNGGAIFTGTFSSGNAGDVVITARNLLIDGWNIPTTTFVGSSTQPNSNGAGGQVDITVADTLTVRNGGQINASTSGTGDAGSVTMKAGQVVRIAGGYETVNGKFSASGLFVSAYATGQTGNLTLTTPSLTISDGGGIFATSGMTSGGNLYINAADLRLFNGGRITTSVFGDETTTGGNVEINSRTVLALDGSTVTARANQGKGGNILVNTDVFLHDAPSVDNVLNASSESTVTGNQGSVTVNTALDPGRSIVGVSRRLGDLNDANQDPCARRKGIKKSTLTQVGLGGMPADNHPEGMTVSLSGGDWTPPVEAAPVQSEPLALNADRDDCRL